MSSSTICPTCFFRTRSSFSIRTSSVSTREPGDALEREAPQQQQQQQRPIGTPDQISQVSVTDAAVLPPPAMFQGFEDVVPGAANRILLMAESEAQHRHWLDRR